MTTKTLSERLTDLVTSWQKRENELIDWLTGSKDGGPQSDGKYPLTTRNGDIRHVMSPAAVADMVSGPAAEAKDEANAAKMSAKTATTAAEDALSQANEAQLAQSGAENDANRAENARDEAENAESNVRTRTSKHFPDSQTMLIPNATTVAHIGDQSHGAFGWDDTYFYIHTTQGVKRIPLESI